MGKKVAVIGAGIFGSTAALELAKTGEFEITLFERNSTILNEATFKNLLRLHQGYHYPRSKKTALECIKSNITFRKEFSECLFESFPSYYAIVKEGSKTSSENFLKFCDELKLPYQIDWPGNGWLDRSKIALCIKTNEAVYDPDKLREVVFTKLDSTLINLLLNHKVIGGKISGTKKVLKIESPNGIYEEGFDFVIGAVYSHLNEFARWFNFQTEKVRYQLFEVLEIELPVKEKIGIIVIDGNFSAFLPNGFKKNFRLANAGESSIKKIFSDYSDINRLELENTQSNWKLTLERAKYFYPIMKEANVVKSLYLTQIVKDGIEDTDERPSEIISYGNGIYSIFAGKVVTCIETAKRIVEMMRN